MAPNISIKITEPREHRNAKTKCEVAINTKVKTNPTTEAAPMNVSAIKTHTPAATQ